MKTKRTLVKTALGATAFLALGSAPALAETSGTQTIEVTVATVRSIAINDTEGASVTVSNGGAAQTLETATLDYSTGFDNDEISVAITSELPPSALLDQTGCSLGELTVVTEEPNNFQVGDVVTTSGVDPTGHNVTAKAVTGIVDEFAFILADANCTGDASGSGGTVTAELRTNLAGDATKLQFVVNVDPADVLWPDGTTAGKRTVGGVTLNDYDPGVLISEIDGSTTPVDQTGLPLSVAVSAGAATEQVTNTYVLTYTIAAGSNTP